MFTFWLLMESNLNLHHVFSRFEPAAVGQTWDLNSLDQVSVWIRSGSVEVQDLSVGGFWFSVRVASRMLVAKKQFY